MQDTEMSVEHVHTELNTNVALLELGLRGIRLDLEDSAIKADDVEALIALAQRCREQADVLNEDYHFRVNAACTLTREASVSAKTRGSRRRPAAAGSPA